MIAAVSGASWVGWVALAAIVMLAAILGVLAWKIGETQADIWFGPPEDPGKVIRDRQRGIAPPNQ